MANIHSLFSSKNKKNANNSGDEDSDDDKRQGFYVGGSDTSGQEVLGPSNNDMSSRLFEAAQRAGAEQMSPEEYDAWLEERRKKTDVESSSSQQRQYQGGTFRLGGHGVPSESVQVQANIQRQSSSAASSVSQPVGVQVIMWTDGFSIEDGPLRRFDDPVNRPFLTTLMQGRIPPELSQLYPNRKIDIHMERRNTEYVRPKAKPFGGSGQRLGSVVPNVVGDGVELVDLEPPNSTPLSAAEVEKLLKDAQEAVGLRADEPSGRIQIRIGSSPPIVGQFNHAHTVQDIRNFIVTAQPSLAFQPFSLMSGRPPKVVDNESQTLKDADMINSVVLVKFI